MTVAAADALAGQLDEQQQYEHETGPCLHPVASGQIVDTFDLAREGRRTLSRM